MTNVSILSIYLIIVIFLDGGIPDNVLFQKIFIWNCKLPGFFVADNLGELILLFKTKMCVNVNNLLFSILHCTKGTLFLACLRLCNIYLTAGV